MTFAPRKKPWLRQEKCRHRNPLQHFLACQADAFVNPVGAQRVDPWCSGLNSLLRSHQATCQRFKTWRFLPGSALSVMLFIPFFESLSHSFTLRAARPDRQLQFGPDS